MKSCIRAVAVGVVSLVLACMSLEAAAGVLIGATRVIYTERDKEITVRLTNHGEVPTLVQVWIDKGDDLQKAPEAIETPFLVVPPLFRMEPKRGQSIRLFRVGGVARSDVESVYWLNVLEVPPKPASGAEDYLQVSIRNRIKLFYRPSGLKGSATLAPNDVIWSLVAVADGFELRAQNPTPFHITFSKVIVKGETDSVEFGPLEMLAPGATAQFRLKKGDATQLRKLPQKINYFFINDYGGVSEGHSPVSNPSQEPLPVPRNPGK